MKLLAQITNPALQGPLSGVGGQGGSALGLLISNLIFLLFVGAFLMALFFLLLGGLQWITSGGDKNGLESARNKITNALIGLIIVGAVWAILMLIGKFLGIDFPNLRIPSMGG